MGIELFRGPPNRFRRKRAREGVLGWPKARTLLAGEMEKLFFGSGSTKPEGYVQPSGT